MLVFLADEPETVSTVQNLSSLLSNSDMSAHSAGYSPSLAPSNEIEEEVVVLETKLNDKRIQENGATAIVDSGSPITIAGLEWFKKYLNTMPKAIRSKLEVVNSNLYRYMCLLRCHRLIKTSEVILPTHCTQGS